MTRAFGTALLVLLISNSYQAFLKPWNGIKWRKKKLTCFITLLFLKSLIFTGKNQWEVCIHASCSFPPLEPSRGPIPKIPVWTQSQSKFLGQFAVFLPSQCWCARFGELTAMNNIVRTSRRARSKKTKQCWVEVSQLFLTETVGMMLVWVLFLACLDGIGFRLAEQNKRQLSCSKRLTSKCPLHPRYVLC